MKRLTKLEDKDLEYYHDKILRFSNTEKIDILTETDEFIFNLISQVADINEENYDSEDGIDLLYNQSNDDYYRNEMNHLIDSLKNKLRESRNKIESGDVDQWQAGQLENSIEYLLEETDENSLSVDVVKDIKSLIKEAQSVVDKLKVESAMNIINDAMFRDFHNISSIKKAIREMEECKYILNEHNLYSDDIRKNVFRVIERCAWHRANKKLLDLEIAEKTRNTNKAIKLKIEAQALLEQDWRQFFKNDNYPIIKQYENA